MSLFDGMFEAPSWDFQNNSLPQDLKIRLRIEKLCDRISKSMYFMSESPGVGNNVQNTPIKSLLNEELLHIEMDLATPNLSGI